MVKLIYENGHFYRRRKGKLIQVNKYGIPINKADQISSTEKNKKSLDHYDGDFFEKTVDAATTKEGMGTIGGAAVGGWIGSSVGIAALGTAVAGTLPIAAAGGLIGYLAVKAFGSDDKKKKK